MNPKPEVKKKDEGSYYFLHPNQNNQEYFDNYFPEEEIEVQNVNAIKTRSHVKFAEKGEY